MKRTKLLQEIRMLGHDAGHITTHYSKAEIARLSVLKCFVTINSVQELTLTK